MFSFLPHGAAGSAASLLCPNSIVWRARSSSWLFFGTGAGASGVFGRRFGEVFPVGFGRVLWDRFACCPPAGAGPFALPGVARICEEKDASVRKICGCAGPVSVSGAVVG